MIRLPILFLNLFILLSLGFTACKSKQNLANLSSKSSNSAMDTSPIVIIETSLGTLQVQLFASTPQHRDNFVKLVQAEYYDGLLFHRVIKDFMIQGGDPESRQAGPAARLGTGGPGYTVPAEINNQHRHFKGALAAARQGDQVNPLKASSGSQFYLVQGKPVPASMLQQIEQYRGFQYSEEERQRYQNLGGTPHLDNEYTVFGQVIEGLEIIDLIAQQPCNGQDRPKTDVRIIKAYLAKKPQS